MMTLDEKLFLWINNNLASQAMDSAMTVITISGDARSVILLGLAAVWLGGARPLWKTAAAFLAAMALGGGVMHAIKQSAPIDRPLAHFEERIKSGAVVVRAPHERLFHRAFPSGHTQAAFTAAVFLALVWRRRPLAAGLLMWASLVGLSRIYLGAHFPSDVAGGAVLGAVSAWAIYRTGKDRGWIPASDMASEPEPDTESKPT